jgi:hypothetical protein
VGCDPLFWLARGDVLTGVLAIGDVSAAWLSVGSDQAGQSSMAKPERIDVW